MNGFISKIKLILKFIQISFKLKISNNFYTMSFLTAEWKKLAIANYSIDKEVLAKYIPYKTELDLWEGNCYVSLVGFMFKNTKLLGLRIPSHSCFEEVNLRFYVKYKENNIWKRGVVFIKELVPRPALTFVANTFYKEHYETVAMEHTWELNNNHLEVLYGWEFKNKEQSIKVVAKDLLQDIPLGSETEFITEHYWGYTKINETKTFEYEVTHPRWQAYPIEDYNINVDFGLVYGKDFQFLNNLTPKSVMLAEGSKITVENKRQI